MSPLDELPSQREFQLADRQDEQNQRDLFQTPETSEIWAHWEYSPEEWALLDQIDWHPQRFSHLVLVGGILLSLLGCPLSFFLSSNSLVASLVGISAFLLFMAISVIGIFVDSSYPDARERHKARQKLPQTVTFSEKGVWEAGTYFPLDEDLVVLKKVTLTSQPSVLHFHLTKVDRNPDNSPLSATLRVLVPQGHEVEAGHLLERFQTDVLQEQVREE